MSPKFIRSLPIAFALTFAPLALAGEPQGRTDQKEATTEEPSKVPTTPDDHFALAKKYQEKATGYRKEAEEHRKMAAAFRKGPLNAQKPRGQQNPKVIRMEKHCAAIAAAAEKLAIENEKAADFHSLRGKELQGQ